jgi:hypothetical protein
LFRGCAESVGTGINHTLSTLIDNMILTLTDEQQMDGHN